MTDRSNIDFPGKLGDLSTGRNVTPFQIAYAGTRWKRHNLYCPKANLLFGFTPKAGCSTIAKLFFYNAEGHELRHFQEWPHRYRLDYQRKAPTRLSSWLSHRPVKIKFVRDPFARAVSCYTHMMRTKLIQYMVKVEGLGIRPGAGRDRQSRLPSFSEFLDWLETIRLEFANPHFGLQRIPFERTVFRYDYVVKIEQMQERITEINASLDVPLTVPKELLASRHHLTRRAHDGSFVGETPYYDLGISADGRNAPPYASFYNETLARKVQKLFSKDIELYNHRESFDHILQR